MKQGGVDLAEFDAPPADLDLVVGAALEVQALGLQPNQIPAAVGPLPAQRGQRRVLIGVLLRVQVAGQTHPADHQFAHAAPAHRRPGAVDDGEVPARQRQPDADRAPVEARPAGHHGGLGGPVGVPDLAPGSGVCGREPFGQVRRTGLAAEDQQPHRLERLRRPQGSQGRDGGHHGDVPRHQPGSQVHPAADQRARSGHQAGAVAPGQPHLLAGGVEPDRQACQDPVIRTDWVVLQEHTRLGVDEGRGVAVGHGHPFGQPGRPGGEDDPGVVSGRRRRRAPAARRARAAQQARLGDDPGDRGLAEDKLGPLIGVVGVDRDVRRARGEGGQDRHVERVAARGHPDTHPVPAADSPRGQPPRPGLDVGDHLGVGQSHLAVVDPDRIRVTPGRRVEDVDEGARRGGVTGAEILRRDSGSGHEPES